MRIDLLLCRLRFTRSRKCAQEKALAGHMRINGERVRRASHAVATGDVLTFPHGHSVMVCQIEDLPQRRGPAEEARSYYRVLDPGAHSDLAGRKLQDCPRTKRT